MTPNELEAYDAMMHDRDRWRERAERLEGLCPSDATTCSPVFSVDYDLIRKVMDSLNHLGDDSDSDCACRRAYCRMLAEATGMPLAGHRLLMEKEVRPKYRTSYALAPKFQENAAMEPPMRKESQ
jgi:hypothetical protein